MKFRKYQAGSIPQALQAVKRDLGTDALIHKTRTRRKGGLMGIGGRLVYEVVASEARRSFAPYKSEVLKCPQNMADASFQTAAADSGGELAKKVMEIHRIVSDLVRRDTSQSANRVPADLREAYLHLLRQDVSAPLAAEIIEALSGRLPPPIRQDRHAVMSKLAEILAERIAVCPDDSPAGRDGRPAVLVLIGPTGVGKTTTLAKLAANFKLKGKNRVGLITIDTYRIAAVDQLKTYADLIGVPLATVLSPAEFIHAMDQMHGMDVVLVDTAGRSQNDTRRLGQLEKFLQSVSADQVHLVLSATSSQACHRRILDQFGHLATGRLIVTKLDEAETFGMVCNVTAWSGSAVSYITAGQEVPDDIARADSRSLARMIVGGYDAS